LFLRHLSVALQKHSKSNSCAPLYTGKIIWKITEGWPAPRRWTQKRRH